MDQIYLANPSGSVRFSLGAVGGGSDGSDDAAAGAGPLGPTEASIAADVRSGGSPCAVHKGTPAHSGLRAEPILPSCNPGLN